MKFEKNILSADMQSLFSDALEQTSITKEEAEELRKFLRCDPKFKDLIEEIK